MKVKNKSKSLSSLIIITTMLMTMLPMNVSIADNWFEEEPGFFTLFDEDGNELTAMGSEMFKDDEYISGDNKHYSVSRVDKKERSAYAKFLGDIELPEFEEITDVSMEAYAPDKGDRSILLYCTHSDESYVPSDGEPSIPAKGGIYDVAESFKKAMEKEGIKAVLDKTVHDPHDAGAYRRSRQTAVSLIKKNMPVAAVFDIHRDAVPKEQYDAMVNGEYMSKVRIVIGRRNHNREANQELAYKIKAIADKTHSGLIKDIYIGKGEYNQELSPRSLLFEFGTHETSKEAVQKSTVYMADVVNKAIFGGIFKSKEKTETNEKAEGQKEPSKGKTNNKEKTYKVKPINQEEQKGAGKGILWFIIIAVIGVVAFVFISMSKNEMKAKFGKKKRE